MNDRSLKQSEIETISKWVDSGAPEGNSKDAPPPIQWAEGWQFQPDIILDGPTTVVPAKPKNNVVEWTAVVMPGGFVKDTWVTSVQIRPQYPAVTHHVCIAFVPHRADIKYGVAVWQDKLRDENGYAIPQKGDAFRSGRPQGAAPADVERILQLLNAEDCYLPGNPAADYRVFDGAKLIPHGYDIAYTLHYTPNGTTITDHVKLGLTLAKNPPKRRFVSLSISAPTDTKSFAIPPNNPNWSCPASQITFLQDVELVFMMPHMHFRGKDTRWTLEYPDGTKRVVLDIPRYDFNWQLGYNTAINVPKGSKLRVDAHFDNSVNNKFNPDPSKTVYYGQMTWEEMMSAIFGVVVNPSSDASRIITSNAPIVSGGG